MIIMKCFSNIKFLLVAFLFFNESFSAPEERDRSSSSAPVVHDSFLDSRQGVVDGRGTSPSSQELSDATEAKRLETFLSTAPLRPNRKKLQQQKKAALEKEKEEWEAVQEVLTSNMDSSQQAKLVDIFQQDKTPEAQGRLKETLKILVLGPEILESKTGEKSHQPEQAIICLGTSPSDKISLLKIFVEKDGETRNKILEKTYDFLNPKTRPQDRALIARAFSSFSGTEDREDFAKTIKPYKRHLTGRLIYQASEKWSQSKGQIVKLIDHLQLVPSSGARSRIFKNFFDLKDEELRAKILALVPKRFQKNNIKEAYKPLDKDELGEYEIHEIESMVNKKGPENSFNKRFSDSSGASSDEGGWSSSEYSGSEADD